MAHAYTVTDDIRKPQESSFLKRTIAAGDRVVVPEHMKADADGITWLTYEGEVLASEIPPGLRAGGMVIPASEQTPDTTEPEDPELLGDGVLEDLEGKTATQIEDAHDRPTLNRIAEQVFGIADAEDLANKGEVAKAIHASLNQQED